MLAIIHEGELTLKKLRLEGTCQLGYGIRATRMEGIF